MCCGEAYPETSDPFSQNWNLCPFCADLVDEPGESAEADSVGVAPEVDARPGDGEGK